jgi:hypothetical protein
MYALIAVVPIAAALVLMIGAKFSAAKSLGISIASAY